METVGARTVNLCVRPTRGPVFDRKCPCIKGGRLESGPVAIRVPALLCPCLGMARFPACHKRVFEWAQLDDPSLANSRYPPTAGRRYRVTLPTRAIVLVDPCVARTIWQCANPFLAERAPIENVHDNYALLCFCLPPGPHLFGAKERAPLSYMLPHMDAPLELTVTLMLA